ncbi:iron-containing alcohol dehydrogenase [candidate division KSB1 bacterium]|nr:iron-containing alcohol dehydrogenase [candidate division KSB1 bacterium]
MFNFTFHNPVKIVFGKDTIKELPNLIDPDEKILLLYGQGSIKRYGVYDQVLKALKGYKIVEFPGVEANPEYETCMKAVEVVHKEKINFLLSVGGGSVLDATKFVAAAAVYDGKDPWDFVAGNPKAKIKGALPLGDVLTLPATGSEMNTNSVISRASIGEKRAFSSSYIYPRFSILDPMTTMTLPERQMINGIVDTFVHVMEQYLTYDVYAPLQDRFAEGILLTLVQEAPKVIKDPKNYNVRANLMWASTLALNGLIGKGVPGDWATHMIGHELTALHGLDHAQTLAIVLPAVLKHQKEQKVTKLMKYARNVWGVTDKAEPETINAAINRTVTFFNSIGMPTQLSDYKLTPKDCQPCVEKLKKRGSKLGEHENITYKEVAEILELAA